MTSFTDLLATLAVSYAPVVSRYGSPFMSPVDVRFDHDDSDNLVGIDARRVSQTSVIPLPGTPGRWFIYRDELYFVPRFDA